LSLGDAAAHGHQGNAGNKVTQYDFHDGFPLRGVVVTVQESLGLHAANRAARLVAMERQVMRASVEMPWENLGTALGYWNPLAKIRS
jgi:hypothetical protein